MHSMTGRVRSMTETGDAARLAALPGPALTLPASPSEPPQRDGRSRLSLTDLLVAASYTVPAMAAAIVFHQGEPEGLVLPGLAVVISGTALLFRRRAPTVALGATAGIMLITFPLPASFAAVSTAMALYAVAVYRPARHAVLGLLGTCAFLLLGAVLLPRSMDPAQSVQAMAALVIAVLAGLNVRTRRAYVAALRDRADRLMREREHLASIAAATERNAIAREMHDIVSHGLAVMISLAHGSAEIASTDPARAVQAMRQVAETGRLAVTDMRRMLGVLHDGDGGQWPGAVAPSPGVGDVPALMELFRSAGLPVVLHSTGVPPADPGIQLAIYRVLQEGLTNALKYARGATEVTVDVAFTAAATTVSITDDGVRTAVAGDTIGRGIEGMRERVALYGGTLNAGPLPSGGWRVDARIPSLKEASW
jgi:signal transduction histidine kinase